VRYYGNAVMSSSPLVELRMVITAIACSLLLVGVIIFTPSVFIMLPPSLPPNQSAFATFPGENGKIAFTSTRDGNGEIYAINADGSEQTRLTNDRHNDGNPDWSPDGTKIAFESIRPGGIAYEIWVMNADGSDPRMLTSNDANDLNPSWSPDGTKIAFRSDRDPAGIYVMNADGSGETNISNNPPVSHPSWSPDGTKIAFQRYIDGNWEIYVMNADGSGQTNISNNPADDVSLTGVLQHCQRKILHHPSLQYLMT
jgi:Tol biopolymer transport system component